MTLGFGHARRRWRQTPATLGFGQQQARVSEFFGVFEYFLSILFLHAVGIDFRMRLHWPHAKI